MLGHKTISNSSLPEPREQIILQHSKKYLIDLEKCEYNFKNTVKEFLTSHHKKCLVLETKDTHIGAMRITQILKQIEKYSKQNQINKSRDNENQNLEEKNYDDPDKYLNIENQTFISWRDFRKAVGSADVLPKFTNLFVCEFPVSVIIDKADVDILNKIIGHLNTANSVKVIFITSHQGHLNEYIKSLGMKTFLKIDEFDFIVTSMTYGSETEAFLMEASKGHLSEVTEMIENGVDVNSTSKVNGSTALYNAAEKGHEDVVLLLLKHGAHIKSNIDKNTAVHAAARNEHAQVLSVLLDNGVDVNIEGQYKDTALHIAAEHGYNEVALTLLRNGAQDLPNEFNYTPLHLAAKKGNKDIVLVLLEHGFNANVEGRLNMTPLHDATFNDHDDVVKILLQYNADINAQTYGGLTALHMASEKNQLEIVKMLLNKKEAHILPDISKKTPLHLAAKEGHTDVVLALLENDVDVNVKGGEEWTALYEAAYYGHNDVLALLIEHNADINVQASDGSTALHLAAAKKHIELLRTLFKNDVKALVNKAGETPLHCAVKDVPHSSIIGTVTTGSLVNDVVKLLLEHNTNNLNAQDNNGFTALHQAADKQDIEVIKTLLNSGADVDIINNMGDTALHIAAAKGRSEIVKLLVEIGANINIRNINDKSALDLAVDCHHDGTSTLFNVVGNEYKEVVLILLRKGAYIRSTTSKDTALHAAARRGHNKLVLTFLENDVDANIRGEHGQTALHIAAAKGYKDVVMTLLKNGAVILPDAHGETSLHCAVKNEQPKLKSFGIISLTQAHIDDVVDILLKHNVEKINVKDNNGFTALHRAVENNYTEVVKILLKYGTDIDAINNMEDTPLHISAMKGRLEIFRVLIEKGAKYDIRNINGKIALELFAEYFRNNVQETTCPVNTLFNSAKRPFLVPHQSVK